MTREELFSQIKLKRSFLCVGLDPDLEKMPVSLNGNLFEFNKAIIGFLRGARGKRYHGF